jgi:hypothetical protein
MAIINQNTIFRTNQFVMPSTYMLRIEWFINRDIEYSISLISVSKLIHVEENKGGI